MSFVPMVNRTTSGVLVANHESTLLAISSMRHPDAPRAPGRLKNLAHYFENLQKVKCNVVGFKAGSPGGLDILRGKYRIHR